MDATEMPGPGSLHWRYGGDRRGYLLLVRAGLLQLMHPGLGAGVEQHSDFFNEPWQRVLRSVPQIQGTTFDWPEGGATARKIRDYHTEIKGIDQQGRRYHALDPEVYFWAHATIFDALFQSIDMFGKPLSEADKDRLYAEGCEIYRAYGVSDRVMPPNWPSFQAYFDRMCRERLEITPAAQALIDFSKNPPKEFPLVPAPIYRLLRKPSGNLLWWLSVGTLPASVRERIGESWTDADQRRFDRVRRVVSSGWSAVPSRLRHTARARQGYLRTGSGPEVASRLTV
ncbi:oxygenase MpaB family protein [Actinokineospora xionganensis]|uniref:DUF2236 domain-containing protein n=1 Tax=Actinokineospora xionganensis TaxID=2684470 RepID=A0ABR7KZD0_9PSEU|nr:oxygenase MpaB family protein [Actinokineospora xionganensis]MBC6445613.1 DUF2236 domain-containing protein [Actinokineospora xionganensis]